MRRRCCRLEYYLVEIVKPNGLKNYYGKNYHEVFLKYGFLNKKDAEYAFETETDGAQNVLSYIERIKQLGIRVDKCNVVKVKCI